MTQKLSVLLVEPWFGGSHRQWAEGYAAASRHRVEIVSLPAVAWRWRLRGGAAPLAQKVEQYVADHGRPDIVLVSGLVDVAQLFGLTRRSLGGLPVVIMQHESQLLYPTPTGAVDTDSALRNWQSWLAADLVLFNSDYHRRAIEAALPPFLAGQPEPDQLPMLETVLGRFETMPIGLDLAWLDDVASTRTPLDPGGPTVLWPHRWEADKSPEVFLGALRRLRESDRRVRLVLAGDTGASPSTARAAILEEFDDWTVAVGPFSTGEYRSHLRRADIVVSCADHEFFGVGVAEAIAAGASPVLPNRLAYPELVERPWRSEALYPERTFASALTAAVDRVSATGHAVDDGLARSMQRFSWSTIAPRLDACLAGMVSRSDSV